jgi:hypothetical protein
MQDWLIPGFKSCPSRLLCGVVWWLDTGVSEDPAAHFILKMEAALHSATTQKTINFISVAVTTPNLDSWVI